MRTPQQFQVGQVAALTGVSVRTLHHYDGIGLLTPSARSEAGYRLYSTDDLLLLQQILTLRYLGFRLRQIGALLQRPDFDLLKSLRIQRGALRDRIGELERIEATLARLVDHRLASGRWDWELAASASAAVQSGLDQLDQKEDTMTQYYTPEEIKEEFKQVEREASTEELRAVEREWRALLVDVHASLGLPPASPQAQQLQQQRDTNKERTRPFFEGREKLWQSIGRAHLDGRYDDVVEAAHAEDYAFMERVRQASTV